MIRCTILVLILGGLSVQAVPPNHSPFRPGQHPKPFPMRELKRDWQFVPEGWQYDFQPRSRSACRLALVERRDGSAELRLYDPTDRLLLSQPDLDPLGISTRVYPVDLNRDGRCDYVVDMRNIFGCGLAAEGSTVIFLLSSRQGYVAQTVSSDCAEARDFMDLNRDGRPEFLHTCFVFGEPGRDGRTHNYWAYNLLTFSGTNIVSANALDARFPRWVWYTFKPNHRDTDQLTPAQRKRLWLETWSQHGGVFPHYEALADEQARPPHSRSEKSSTGAARPPKTPEKGGLPRSDGLGAAPDSGTPRLDRQLTE
jgi:hypothetical protein